MEKIRHKKKQWPKPNHSLLLWGTNGLLMKAEEGCDISHQQSQRYIRGYCVKVRMKKRKSVYTYKATIIKPNYLHTGRKTVLLSLLHSTETPAPPAPTTTTTTTMKWFKRLRITFGVPFLFLITSIYWAQVPYYSISSFCQFLNKLIIVVSSSGLFFSP